MTLIRKLALVAYSALLCLSYSASTNAQVAGSIDLTTGLPIQETGNLINSSGWTGQSRTGALNGANPRDSLGCCTGSGAYVDTSNGGAIYFSYNNTTVSQSTAINTALANAGSGIRVSGINYGFDYYNQDYNRGTLYSTLNVTGTGGGAITTQHGQTTNGWTNFSNTLPLNSALPSVLGTATLSFSGRDDRFWAGYYGPAVRNPRMSIAYTVDPCAANPAYSTDCSGFSSVTETANQVPNPNGYTYGGGWTLNNSFAINTGLEAAGSTLKVHGFKWGYVANANGPYCGSWDMWIFGCWDYRIPSATTNVNITDKAGASIYSVSRTYTNSYNTTDYQYILPSSKLLSTLGNFNFTATTNDQAYVGSMWAKTLYTPDQCMLNPLSSTTCPGYAAAFKQQQCSANPLYAMDCPGYAEAYKTQQCTANPLYAVDCPGYAVAYKTQQCTNNPLSYTDCPGYGQAMLAKLAASNPPSNTSTTTVVTDPVVNNTSTTTTADPVVSSPSTSTASTSAPTSTSSTLTAAVSDPSTTQTSASPSSSSSVTSASTTSTPSATNPQPKIGEVTTAGSPPKSVSGPSTSQVLSIVRSEQNRVSKLETSTASAATAAAQAAGEQATADAQAVASTSSGQSSNLSAFGFGTKNLSMFSVATLSSGVGLKGPETSFIQTYQPQTVRQSSFDDQKNNNTTSSSATNQVNNILNQPTPIIATTTTETKGALVNKNVKDNDAAGGVSIAAIAKQPQGFELYMGGMVDRPFYAPKEIYRGQKVVDNARAQRLLNGASDRLHQEMVDLQYNKGN